VKLDFLISASPNAGFLSQIAFFRLCLNALGRGYAKARLAAAFGDHDDEMIPDNWLAYKRIHPLEEVDSRTDKTVESTSGFVLASKN